MPPTPVQKPPSLRQPFKERALYTLQDITIEAIQLIGFLGILYVGDLIAEPHWGNKLIVGGLTFAKLLDIGDAALIACFTIRSCLRMFGIMRDNE